MTTHRLEVRVIKPTDGIGDHGQWFSITRDPIEKRDAENLLGMLGPHWEGRIVVASSPVGREFAELERNISAKRWEKAVIAHHPHCHVNEVGAKRGQLEAWFTRAFGTDRSDVMTGEEWRALREITTSASIIRPAIDFIEVRTPTVHVGRCASCGGEKRALSVCVEIVANGKKSVREYAL